MAQEVFASPAIPVFTPARLTLIHTQASATSRDFSEEAASAQLQFRLSRVSSERSTVIPVRWQLSSKSCASLGVLTHKLKLSSAISGRRISNRRGETNQFRNPSPQYVCTGGERRLQTILKTG
ncbi:hypothetical protein BaRGS_00031110 [Batillaria attramentaria]|uniref:Uncharacterized protein n=1 Tax=Batillaria attramentaria TaxID=370345 RepID=A0ABD0JSS0_9CAEN